MVEEPWPCLRVIELSDCLKTANVLLQDDSIVDGVVDALQQVFSDYLSILFSDHYSLLVLRCVFPCALNNLAEMHRRRVTHIVFPACVAL